MARDEPPGCLKPPSFIPSPMPATDVKRVSRDLPSDLNKTSFSNSKATATLPLHLQEVLSSLPIHQFFFYGDRPDFSKPGALDLFSGSYGVARELKKQGAPWVLSYEWQRSSAENLLEGGVRDTIRCLFVRWRFQDCFDGSYLLFLLSSYNTTNSIQKTSSRSTKCISSNESQTS